MITRVLRRSPRCISSTTKCMHWCGRKYPGSHLTALTWMKFTHIMMSMRIAQEDGVQAAGMSADELVDILKGQCSDKDEAQSGVISDEVQPSAC